MEDACGLMIRILFSLIDFSFDRENERERTEKEREKGSILFSNTQLESDNEDT